VVVVGEDGIPRPVMNGARVEDLVGESSSVVDDEGPEPALPAPVPDTPTEPDEPAEEAELAVDGYEIDFDEMATMETRDLLMFLVQGMVDLRNSVNACTEAINSVGELQQWQAQQLGQTLGMVHEVLGAGNPMAMLGKMMGMAKQQKAMAKGGVPNG
jgi:hypothetical protein